MNGVFLQECRYSDHLSERYGRPYRKQCLKNFFLFPVGKACPSLAIIDGCLYPATPNPQQLFRRFMNKVDINKTFAL
jgi:hypothetical protein